MRAAVVHARGDAVAVVLDLVQPLVAVGRGVAQRRQRKRDGSRHARTSGAVPVRAGAGTGARGPRRSPARLLAGGDLLHRAARRDAAVVRPPRVRLARPRLLVTLLDEQPLVLLVAPGAARVHQHPAAPQPLAVQPELELALLEARAGVVAERLPGAGVPQHHRAAAVLAPGDRALEVAVLDGMVLDVDGQPADLGVEAGSLGHGPAHRARRRARAAGRRAGASRRASGCRRARRCGRRGRPSAARRWPPGARRSW